MFVATRWGPCHKGWSISCLEWGINREAGSVRGKFGEQALVICGKACDINDVTTGWQFFCVEPVSGAAVNRGSNSSVYVTLAASSCSKC